MRLIVTAQPLSRALSLIESKEFSADGVIAKRFSWITQLELEPSLMPKFVGGGRCRSKVENETFNTLKNQVYHLDHNFGHGEKYLSTVFAMLMFLAFLVDQVQQLSCPLFAKAMSKFNTKRAYWQRLGSCFETFALVTWIGLYEAIIAGRTRNQPLSFDSG